MLWQNFLPESLLLFLAATPYSPITSAASLNATGWTAQKKLAAREQTRELWYHGFDNYMMHAFPMDEVWRHFQRHIGSHVNLVANQLTPLSCSGQGPDWGNPQNIAVNDVMGNFSLTLIDVLDTFVVLGDRAGFEAAVKDVISWVTFDVNTKPQVFETTIRVLGGLLSGHIFANQSGQPFYLSWYRAELLDLAYDLGKRLLPAFNTPTGLPYARVNLRRGVMKGESAETCTAGAGTLILEFATLSRLTGDDRFERAARKAFFGIWNRKSDIGLVGNTINAWTGTWLSPEITNVGAGIDSFYEYALKWYVLSGDVEFLDVWNEAYIAVMRYSRGTDGFWYRTVNMHSGEIAYFTVDSLSAFWPGLQVIAGDVQSAIRLHLMYYNIWREHSGLPEVFDTNYQKATSLHYPLRPEFIESTWYLYRATRDPFYLDVGERILFDLTTRAKVTCGLSGIQDLRKNKRDDRMESFTLSETLKYLYLLFDEDNPLHKDDSNYVFTTEGHILTLGREHLKETSAWRRKVRGIDNHQCPAYQPVIQARRKGGLGITQGILHRSDVDYARELVGRAPTLVDTNVWSPNGWCERPQVELFSYEFILSREGKAVAEDLSPSLHKLGILPDGFIIQNVTGIRTKIARRVDGAGYDIRKLGHYTVRMGQIVYINDTELFTRQEAQLAPRTDVIMKFFTNTQRFGIQSNGPDTSEVLLVGNIAHFGANVFSSAQPDGRPLRFSHKDGATVAMDADNVDGCKLYHHSHQDAVLVVERGGCTFLEKLLRARAASAAGVIVLSNDDSVISPTASPGEIEEAGDLSDIALVLLQKSGGDIVRRLIERAQRMHDQVVVSLEDDVQQDPLHPRKDPNRILYINGYPLLNTKLLV